MEHGTRSNYVRNKCRCDDCTQANNDYHTSRYASRPPTDFDKVPHATPGGYVYHKCRCEDCCEAQRAHGRRMYAANIEKINQYKLDRGCADCGYKDHPVALDFDHVEGEKSFSIGYRKSYSWKTLLTEIEKCEVVCSNCHRIRTFNRGQDAS